LRITSFALQYRKSCSQTPGLKEAQLCAASTGNKVTRDLIRVAGESPERVTTYPLEGDVNWQPFGAARPLWAVQLKIPTECMVSL